MADTLLDTNVVVDFLKGRSEAVRYIGALTARPCVSVVTVAEIFAGLSSQRGEIAARGFFAQCRCLPLSQLIAEAAGHLVRHYRDSHGVDLPDALIAATADHHALRLATLNVRHFPSIKRLKPAY
jgi:predicted nucleic acid-binding protein